MTEPCWCGGSTTRPLQGPPLATLPGSQLQVLSGFAGKGTVCMCVLAKATSFLAQDVSYSLLGSAGYPDG